MAAPKNPALVWHFSQVFGDKAGEGEIADGMWACMQRALVVGIFF